MQKPSDYINERKRLFPFSRKSMADLSPELIKFNKQHSISPEDILNDINNIDYGERLLEHLKGRLPDWILDLFKKELIGIGAVADPLPNAYTHEVDTGFAIIFNIGLSQFIYRVVRALCTRVSFQDEKLNISFEETCQIISDIFFWFANTEQAMGPSYPISPNQLVFASRLATEAECYFVLHEIGHVLIEASKKYNLELAPVNLKAHEEEYYSDRFAIQILLSRDGAVTDLPPSFSFASAIIALKIYHGLELSDINFDDSHPKASSRVQRLKSYLRRSLPSKKEYQDFTNLSNSFEKVFGKVIETINNPNEEQIAQLEKDSNEILTEIDRLLDLCSGDLFPDYVQFKSKATEIFNRGYSTKLLEKVAHSAKTFFENNKEIKSVKYKNLTEDGGKKIRLWNINFQKYKLFMSLVREFPEPAKSIFDDHLKNIYKY